jgi:hypothetical protein
LSCYSGSNPVKNIEEGIEIWRWAKANGIDHGLPFEEIHELINKEYFSGTGKPEWINEILAGPKTPFKRSISNDIWKAQYNRRQAVLQAQAAIEAHALSPVVKTLKNILALPRGVATFAHGVVFPITHAGELLFRPSSWKVIGRGLLDTWTKSGSDAATERLLNTMKGHEWFDMGIRSGVDVLDKAHETNLFMQPGGRFGGLKDPFNISKNAWSILKVMRFNLWANQMKKFIKPGMTNEAKLEIGKNLAEWANHATGSAKGPLSDTGIAKIMFGPKITQAKLNRVFSDPVKTGRTVAQMAVEKMKLEDNKAFVKIFGNWEKATPGERAVAKTRLSGLTQYLTALGGFLAVNQGWLWATGQKDKDGKPTTINVNNPKKGDFLAFKAGGLEWSIPGMHTEFRALGQMLAAAFMSTEEANKFSHGAGKKALMLDILANYEANKFNPTIGMGIEAVAGHDYMGRPLPWVHDKNIKPGKPPYTWVEYALSHGPIPLTGPIKYVYDQLRGNGMSALDATAVIKGLIMTGVGATGVHIKEDPDAAKRAAVAQALQRR